MKNKIWNGLNSPIVVALVSVFVLAFMFKMWTGGLFSSFDSDDAWSRRIEALGQQEVISFKEMDLSEKTERRFVGKIRNHSGYVVEDLKGTVCLYDMEGELVDVISRELEGVGSLNPGESSEFYLNQSNYSDSYSQPSTSPEGKFRTTIVIVNLSAKEPPEGVQLQNKKSFVDDPFE
jgi:hypothetical protein